MTSKVARRTLWWLIAAPVHDGRSIFGRRKTKCAHVTLSEALLWLRTGKCALPPCGTKRLTSVLIISLQAFLVAATACSLCLKFVVVSCSRFSCLTVALINRPWSWGILRLRCFVIPNNTFCTFQLSASSRTVPLSLLRYSVLVYLTSLIQLA